VNVDAWVQANPGSVALRGWVTYANFLVAIGLTAHSVVQDADGQRFDITPLEDENLRQGMAFIRHIGGGDAFFEAKAKGLWINCPCLGNAK
jgi:hypothetical protein